MPAKAAHDLRKAMPASGVCSQFGPLRVEDKECMQNLARSVDALVPTLWPDGASSNARWMKHLCGVAALRKYSHCTKSIESRRTRWSPTP